MTRRTRRPPRPGPSPGTLALVSALGTVALAVTVLCKAWPM